MCGGVSLAYFRFLKYAKVSPSFFPYSGKRKHAMQLTEHPRLMAEYNQWMNVKIYDAASTLPTEELSKNRGAFFGSILGTLNHLVVADTLWLKRIALQLSDHTELHGIRDLAQPPSLDAILFPDFPGLHVHRKFLDETLVRLAQSLTEAELSSALHYTNMKGLPFKKVLFSVLMHVFNHQTHHRGQVTTLLSQAGIDVGVTDLVMMLPEALS